MPRWISASSARLQPRDQHYLAENFLAFFERDYARVAALHIESGWVPRTARVDELESAVRTVCEPIFNKPLKEISFAQVLLRLFETARRFDMQVQPQLILLQKTLLNIEGLGRQLYPELDLWKTAQPILRTLDARAHESPNAAEASARTAAGHGRGAEAAAAAVQTAVREAAEGRLRWQVQSAEIEGLRRELRMTALRRDITLVAVILWLSGFMWLIAAVHVRWLGWLLLMAAAGLLVSFGWSRPGRHPP